MRKSVEKNIKNREKEILAKLEKQRKERMAWRERGSNQEPSAHGSKRSTTQQRNEFARGLRSNNDTGFEHSQPLQPNPFKHIDNGSKGLPPGLPVSLGMTSKASTGFHIYQNPLADPARQAKNGMVTTDINHTAYTQSGGQPFPSAFRNEETSNSPANVTLNTVLAKLKGENEQDKIDEKLANLMAQCDQLWADNLIIRGLINQSKIIDARQIFTAAQMLVAMKLGIPGKLIPLDS
jgi:hypothetical protein